MLLPLLIASFGSKFLELSIVLRSISGLASSGAHLKGDPFNCQTRAPLSKKGPETIAFPQQRIREEVFYQDARDA